jgi:hypothetical protein
VSTLLDTLGEWVEQRGRKGQLRPWLVFKPPNSLLRKRAAVVEVEEPAVMGQVTLWETGECEVDLGSTTDPNKTLIKSYHVVSTTDLLGVLGEAMDFCTGLLTE